MIPFAMSAAEPQRSVSTCSMQSSTRTHYVLQSATSCKVSIDVHDGLQQDRHMRRCYNSFIQLLCAADIRNRICNTNCVELQL
jgi:hypothetical protein